MAKVAIIGYGVVGHHLEEEIKVLKPDIIDKYKPECNRITTDKPYDIAWICVDTPYVKGNPCDRTEVRNAIMENEADVFIMKSTVLPGTVDKLIEDTGKHIIFSPEFYGGTQHCNNFVQDYTILGGNREDCIKVQNILQDVYDARHQFKYTDTKTAELTKYMCNSWLAYKVSFCVEFSKIAEKLGVDYEELRELWLLDTRVNPAHTFVYRDRPYWDSHCFNKDVPAIAEQTDSKWLKALVDYNEMCKLNR